MNNESLSSTVGFDALTLSLFNAFSGTSILVQANPPIFNILAVTPDYLTTSGYAKNTLLGREISEAFPANETDPCYTSDKDLYASLKHVIHHKEPHIIPLQRYYLQTEDGFTEKLWMVSNKPVFAAGGELACILITAEDSDTKRNLEETTEELKRFKFMADNAQDPFILMKQDGTFAYLNRKALDAWGYTEEEAKNITVPDVDPVYQQEAYTAVFAHAQQGQPLQFETLHRRKDGHVYPVEVNMNGIILNDKPHMFAVARNITERKKAEAALLESEAKFRTMAESTPVLIAVGDETGNIIYFNKAWTTLTGKPTEELLRVGWDQLLLADDREQFVTIFQTAFINKTPFHGEFRIQDVTGQVQWLLAHGVPRFDTGGNFMGYIGACTEITENKTSQQQLQTALEQIRLSKEAAELGTFDMNLEEGSMHWDDRCRILFGISHHDTVTYEKDFLQGLHPDDRDRIIKVIDDVFIKSISNGDYDVEYRTVGVEDGIVRWVRAKGKVYFNEQEKPVRFIGSVLDISDQKTAIQKIETLVAERTKELAVANETLQNINKELKRSNQNLEEFAHAASHDLKEPVRKIQFFTHQLKDQLSSQLTQAQTGAFNRIENATERMGNLIDDLLIYSHVSHSPMEMEKVDLNQKVQNVLEDLELVVQEKRATINIDPLPEVNGYRRQLQQLFQNLITNSLKYSKQDDPPVINIKSALIKERDKSYHQIFVQDNGIGFEQVYTDKIFQMFSRLHGKTEYSGTGVGLSIVKKVVENHKGIIRVESTPSVGSTFTVLLPAD